MAEDDGCARHATYEYTCCHLDVAEPISNQSSTACYYLPIYPSRKDSPGVIISVNFYHTIIQTKDAGNTSTISLSAFAKSLLEKPYTDPIRNIADTPIFLRRGSCIDQTAGRGSMTKYKSLTTLTAPVITINGRVLEHSGDVRPIKYAV